MGLITTTFNPRSSGVRRFLHGGTEINTSYDISGDYQFFYQWFYNPYGVDARWQIEKSVIQIQTDAAGCKTLSFSVNGTKAPNSTVYWKITSSFTTDTSGMTACSFSGGKFSGSMTANLLPNTTYYVLLYATWPSVRNTAGTLANGTLTFSATGTYGSPGEIIANNTSFDSPINMSYGSATAGGAYTVTVQVGSSPAVTLQTQDGTASRAWTPSLASYGPSYPNQSSVPCTITVWTYFGGTLSGSKTRTVTISFTEEQAGPSTSNAFSITPQNESPIAGMSGYIQNYSKIRAAFAAANVTTRYGATIEKWTVKFGTAAAEDVAAGTAVKDSGIISVTTEVTCTVTDSRGFTASETFTATITPYQQPTLTASFFRSNSEGTEDDAGTYLSVTVSALYADIAGQNTITVLEYSKLAAAQNYGQPVAVSGGSTTQTGTNKKYEKTGFLIQGFTDNIFDIKITATDALGNEAMVLGRIASQAWAIHFRNRGAGAALGKAAEYDGVLDVGTWDIYLRDSNGNIVSLKTVLGI